MMIGNKKRIFNGAGPPLCQHHILSLKNYAEPKVAQK